MAKMKDYDFSGWATKNDLKCSDGRIIRRDAFKHNDGTTVPLVWNHDHTDPYRVIGHALLENRDDGVYAYGKFNSTELGQTAKIYVEHGDITAMSIYANQIQQQGPNVMHGNIRELSLVLAGANPGAYIENVMVHGEENGEEARICAGIEGLELYHADKENDEKKPETKKDEPEKKGDPEMADENKEKTIGEVFDTLTEEQKKAVYAIIASITEEVEDDDESEGGNNDMKHNVFDPDEMNTQDVLSHAEMQEILTDAQRCGSLKEAVLQHGITSIDVLFPDAKTITNEPEFIKRDDSWVAGVLGGVHHTPFSRVKSIFANITADEARAKGYTKGKKKIDEVFTALKRVTNPTTIYKKQKIDRDDMLDITDFNVVAWLKSEMRMMLNEELARAVLVGDGRTASVEDKIKEDCIRPIWTDDSLYTINTIIEVSKTATADEKAREFIKACIKSRKDYKGSGNPSMYMSEDMLTDCLLIEDKNGRVIYDTVEKLAAALRVRKIVPVPVMEGLTREVSGKTHILAGIYVNLSDYNIGTDKGGEVNMFDDFDIDYNAQKYLMETRCSGALTRPYSAVAIEFKEADAEG